MRPVAESSLLSRLHPICFKHNPVHIRLLGILLLLFSISIELVEIVTQLLSDSLLDKFLKAELFPALPI